MNRLTSKQENFCQNIVSGKTQYESYLDAYPSSKKWKRNSVDNKASLLFENVKIVQRIAELKKPTEDLLEANRKKLIEKALKVALKDEKVRSTTVTMLTKLLDKLVATKSESKIETRDKTLEDFLKEL